MSPKKSSRETDEPSGSEVFAIVLLVLVWGICECVTCGRAPQGSDPRKGRIEERGGDFGMHAAASVSGVERKVSFAADADAPAEAS
jgi:hypothetical protein